MTPITGPSSLPLQQDDVHSLLRERVDLHAQLADAVQIQRKLSGPRVLRCGDLQFARDSPFSTRHANAFAGGCLAEGRGVGSNLLL
jgi:hypothetical protein